MDAICPQCQSRLSDVDSSAKDVICLGCGFSVPLTPAATAAWLPAEALLPPAIDAVPATATSRIDKTVEWIRQEEADRAHKKVKAAEKLPQIEGYEVLQVLGRGGMGVVYLARQHGLNRLVALKMVLAGPHADAELVGRFRAEAISVARLQHPHIVQVYEVGEAGGSPFFSLEYIAGGSLAQHLGGIPQSTDEAALLVRTLALAMQYAHEQGIIHRDLKPANVLLRRFNDQQSKVRDPGSLSRKSEGDSPFHSSRTSSSLNFYQPKITDFGLAKQFDDDSGMTATGAVIGTPSYMAPEQAAGLVRDLGPAVDVYALGAILYELLTGRPPFRATTMLDTLEQVRNQEPVPPSRLQQKIPRDLETICLKCLQKSPAKRYAGAGDLAEDLRRFLAREPILARPVGPAERFTIWCKRNPIVAGLAAAVAFALLAGTVFSTHYAIDARREKDRADQKAILADEKSKDALAEMQRADDIATEAEANLYAARMNLVQTDWENGSIGRIVELLEPYRMPPIGKPDLRGWEWYYRDRLCHWDLRTLRGHQDAVSCVAFSPDGRKVASAGSDWTIKVWDAASGHELRTFRGHSDGVGSVVFSPDGRRIASASVDQTIKIWDEASGQELRTLKGHIAPVRTLACSSDGRWLASGSDDQTIKIWDAASGEELRTIKAHEQKLTSVSFSPDSRRLASAAWEQNVKIWDATSGRELRKFEMGSMSVAFSPDGRKLASGNWDNSVAICDTDSGQVLWNMKQHTLPVYSVAFSPDGSRLASASADLSIKVWEPSSGQELRSLKGHTLPVVSLAFSPNGSRLVSGSDDRTIKIWDPASDQEYRTLKGHSIPVVSVAFSPEGNRLASVSTNMIKVHDSATGQELRTLRKHTNQVWSVVFSPHGGRLASASEDRTIMIWDAASGQHLRTLEGHTEGVKSVAFNHDGSRVASAGNDRTIRIWDAASGHELRTLNAHTLPVLCVAFSPDGSRLASGSGDLTIKLWDATTYQELRSLTGQGRFIPSVAFSPNSRWLASASDNGTITIWDAITGEELRTLKGHTGRVLSVAFNRNGTRLASGSMDRTIRIWDPIRGQELQTLKGQNNWVYCVAFHPDGQRLASGGSAAKVIVWDARPSGSEVDRQREAFGLVEHLCAKSISKEMVVKGIRTDMGITDEVRRDALSLLDDYWPRHLESGRSN